MRRQIGVPLALLRVSRSVTTGIAVAVTILAVMSVSAFAGSGDPSGARRDLSIVGVPKDGRANMTGDDGRRVFVKLGRNTRINLQEGGAFKVLDANGTDANGALFQLPNPDADGDGATAFRVHARALRKPGGPSAATACREDETGTWCATEGTVLVRGSRKSSSADVGKELLTLVVDLDGDGVRERVGLLSAAAYSYFWFFDDAGRRVAQLRFYEVPTTVGTAP